MITRDPKAAAESRKSKPAADNDESSATEPTDSGDAPVESRPKEVGGRQGPDPTRYGDWEKGGRCIDF